MADSLVSVIIPCYNVQRYVEAAICSVLSQTYSNLELILVDDGSTDSTWEILRKYQSRKVRIIKQENAGACRARNVGVYFAQGEYIQFLDADDMISNDKIDSQIKMLQGAQDRIAICDTTFFLDGTDHLKILPSRQPKYVYTTDDVVGFLVNLYGGFGGGSMVSGSAWLTPRQLAKDIGPWNEAVLQNQDGEYFCRAVLASKGIVYSAKGTDYYRKYTTSGSISSNRSYATKASLLLSLDLIANHLSSYTASTASKRALSRLYMEFAVANYPAHKGLVNFALQRASCIGEEIVIPRIGGNAIEVIRMLLGWRCAKVLSAWYSKISRKN